MGWSDENTSFVIELVFNYGLDQYKRGNEIQALLLHQYDKHGIDMEQELQSEIDEGKGVKDDITGIYKLLYGEILIKFEDQQAPYDTLIYGVCLNVSNLKESIGYYSRIGLQQSKHNDLEFTFKDYPYFTMILNEMK